MACLRIIYSGVPTIELRLDDFIGTLIEYARENKYLFWLEPPLSDFVPCYRLNRHAQSRSDLRAAFPALFA